MLLKWQNGRPKSTQEYRLLRLKFNLKRHWEKKYIKRGKSKLNEKSLQMEARKSQKTKKINREKRDKNKTQGKHK